MSSGQTYSLPCGPSRPKQEKNRGTEVLWNRLATTHAFSLLCGYSMGSFYENAARAAIQHQHSHVIAGNTLPALPGAPAN